MLLSENIHKLKKHALLVASKGNIKTQNLSYLCLKTIPECEAKRWREKEVNVTPWGLTNTNTILVGWFYKHAGCVTAWLHVRSMTFKYSCTIAVMATIFFLDELPMVTKKPYTTNWAYTFK